MKKAKVEDGGRDHAVRNGSRVGGAGSNAAGDFVSNGTIKATATTGGPPTAASTLAPPRRRQPPPLPDAPAATTKDRSSSVRPHGASSTEWSGRELAGGSTDAADVLEHSTESAALTTTSSSFDQTLVVVIVGVIGTIAAVLLFVSREVLKSAAADEDMERLSLFDQSIGRRGRSAIVADM